MDGLLAPIVGIILFIALWVFAKKRKGKDEIKILPDMPIEDVVFETIEEALVNEEGWGEHEIGPSGQSFRLDLDVAGNQTLFLHDLVQSNHGGHRETLVSNLISPGRYLMFDPAGLNTDGLAGYDQMDRISWHGYIRENLTDGQNMEEIFGKPLLIVGPLSGGFGFSAKEPGTSEIYNFPLLILSLPNFVKLSKKNI